MRSVRLHEHLYGFYDGRFEKPVRADETSWVDDGALSLGICSYALLDGEEALVFDTGVSVDHGRLIRHTLEQAGAKRITVVLSHWHLDHVAGNEAFADCPIVSSARTAEVLLGHRTAIESGTLEGPPAIHPLVMPTQTYAGDRAVLQIGNLEVELLRFAIHSDDATVVRVPSLGLLLVGDTVEDTITYVTEPEAISRDLDELERLRGLDFAQLFPSHGSLERIQAGGYDEGLIRATERYLRRLLEAADGQRNSPLSKFVQPELERGWITYYAPYERVHEENVQMLRS